MAEYMDQSGEFFDRKTHRGKMKMPRAHFHHQHELYYLERGQTKYFVGDEIFLLEPGDLLFVPKFTFHKTDNLANTHVERLLLSFDDQDLGPRSQELLEELGRHKLVRVPGEAHYKLREIFLQLEEEERNKSTDYRHMQRLYLQQLLILANRLRDKLIATPQSPQFLLVQAITKYISENPEADLSLGALSRRYATSQGHLSRLFKTITGLGLNEYVNISRITAAEKLLLQGQASITQIALRCGFNDSNYFAAVFKRLKGITPKKYALLHR